MKKDRCFAFDKKMHIIPSFLLSKVFNELIKIETRLSEIVFLLIINMLR